MRTILKSCTVPYESIYSTHHLEPSIHYARLYSCYIWCFQYMKLIILCFLAMTNLTFAATALFNNPYNKNRPMSSATIKKRERLADKTLEVTFELDEKDSFKDYQAGHKLAGYFPKLAGYDVYKQDTVHPEYFRRTYSVASTPEAVENTGEIKITIAQVDNGLASHWMEHANIGERFWFLLPYGNMTPPTEPTKRLLLLATGTGLVPFYTWTTQMSKLKCDKIHIIASSRRPSEAIYSKAFHELSNQHKHIHYQETFTREKVPNTLYGRIQTHLEALKPDPKTDLIYLCGGPDFVDQTTELLSKLGFEKGQSLIKEGYPHDGHNDSTFSITPLTSYSAQTSE